MGKFVTTLLERLLVKMVAHADRARDNEVHFENFFLLIENDILSLFVGEVSRHQPESHIVKELGVLVLLRVEENTEVVENVVE